MSKEKNRQILIYIGIPGSGKSTAAKEYVLNNPDWVRVCRDEFRYALKNQQMCDLKIEDLITKLVVDTTRSALNKKLNVILDATHVRVKYIEAIIEEFKYEADIDYRVFDISVKKAIERDAVRDKKVGAQVIEKMFEQYKILLDSFHFQPHKKINKRPLIIPNFYSKKQNAIIVDLDGTLFNMGNRGPFDWEKVGLDTINPVVELVVNAVREYAMNNIKIILLSGRDESCRKHTEKSLEDNGIDYDELHMRKKNDFRKDTIIKEEIYWNEVEPRYNVLFAVDDRLSVLKDTWFKLGIFSLCCNQGLIEF